MEDIRSPTPPEPGKFWYCRHCGSQGKIHTWTSELSLRVETELDMPGFGTHYVCLNDGLYGRMSDRDAPIQITEKEHDKYWRELQTDSTFQIPKETT